MRGVLAALKVAAKALYSNAVVAHPRKTVRPELKRYFPNVGCASGLSGSHQSPLPFTTPPRTVREGEATHQHTWPPVHPPGG